MCENVCGPCKRRMSHQRGQRPESYPGGTRHALLRRCWCFSLPAATQNAVEGAPEKGDPLRHMCGHILTNGFTRRRVTLTSSTCH